MGFPIEDMKIIGQGKGYDKRRIFECNLRELAQNNKHPLFQFFSIGLNHNLSIFYKASKTWSTVNRTKINSIYNVILHLCVGKLKIGNFPLFFKIGFIAYCC